MFKIMENKVLEIKTNIQIQQPVTVVFEAIVDPSKMSQYFIAKSSGRMEDGKTLTWQFPEFPDDVPVIVGKIIADEYVSFYWNMGTNQLLVEISLLAIGNDTLVTVTEKSMDNNEEGIKWLKGNTEGWANFLACMKAYLDHGINLRKGAFDFMRKP